MQGGDPAGAAVKACFCGSLIFYAVIQARKPPDGLAEAMDLEVTRFVTESIIR